MITKCIDFFIACMHLNTKLYFVLKNSLYYPIHFLMYIKYRLNWKNMKIDSLLEWSN